VQDAEAGKGAVMTPPDFRQAGRQEGERPKDAVYSRLAAVRKPYVRNARRERLFRLLVAGKAGEPRKDAAHPRPEAVRNAYVRNARRELLVRLIVAGTATADDVVEMIELIWGAVYPIDPRWRGAVPGPLARAGIIRDTGLAVRSCRPEAHGRKITVWELADYAAAEAWLAQNPELPVPSPDEDGDAWEP
jgi:hypothetical protein